MNIVNRSLSAVAFGLAASFGASAQDGAAGSNEIIGSLQDVEGTVLIKRGAESLPVVEGQQVFATDDVLVTEGAKAILVFVDGCDISLDAAELYEVPRRSPCATLWWAAPAAAGVACGAAHADKSDNSRTLAAVGLAAGAALITTAHNREQDYREFAAAVESTSGEVMATNAEGQMEVVRPGTRLRADQEVLVRNGGKALLRFDDGCTKALEVGGDGETRYVVPGNSPCFRSGMWWASAAAAAALCVTVENEDDVSSP
jgi:hypothetical protein